MARHGQTIVITELNGRNGADPPLALPDDQAVEMLNVDRWDGMVGRKRGGTTAVATSGGTAFSSGMQTLLNSVPGADETARQFWGVDGAATPIVKRINAGTTFANITVDDAIVTHPQDVVGATLNGKLFLAYDSTQDRLHVYDPNLSSPRVRRVNLAPGANAPTVANTGSGSYAAVLRYYRVRWLQMSGSLVIRRSEATPSVSFTPSGSGTAARVTQPTPPGEGETHWEIEGSANNSVWFVIFGVARSAQIVIGTTTGDDTNSVTVDYTSFPISDPAGMYALFPSVKHLITDANRLLGSGAWEAAGTTSGGKNSRIWFTPVLGSADKGDDERIPNQTLQKNWVDLNENDGGGITGLGGPISGIPYAFKYRQIWKLRATGDVTTPYLPKKIIDGIGSVNHKSIALGEDEIGRPALYFLSHRGAYRLLQNDVLQYLWRDNEDLIINLGAATVVAHSVYYPDKHQWWLWIATGSSDDPDTLMVFDPLLGEVDRDGRVRKGWFRMSGNLATARCSTVMSHMLGASMSRDLKPYIGMTIGTAIQQGDTTALDDDGLAFQAYVKTKPIAAAPLGTNAGVSDALVLAEVGSTTLTLSLDRDYGAEVRTSTVSLAAAGTETRTLKKFEASAISGAGTIQATIGDGSALAQTWVIDALVLPTTMQEPR